ncbi:Integrator complex subunit 11 [Blyttiomyces sp. JEL0837]|nr:Integrator complex subunit 11 [Blyttiomyces sp. JEL0837]
MGKIRCVPLGAGQDVGRSCLILNIGGKNLMLDCGLHMAYNDERKWPDFAYLSKTGDFNSVLDCIIISHFHLDHCGALPYFTEVCGYDGPIYMTHPTRSICPILLDDMRKVVVERKGETNFFTAEDVRNCMRKVISVSLHETVQVDEDLEIRAYYAGHVLGAAMFHIRVGNESVVYTGDYNMTPDRHLGAAWIDRCRPDLLITESTYAATIRESKRSREQDFLEKVHKCVADGGKVLIPVFALGRAQELCILIDQYWERMALKVPVYFSAGLTERANQYYKLFISWTNEEIKSSYMERNMFDFKNVKTFDRTFADEPGAMVLFASPGMLHAGTSLDIFKKWCSNPKNMIILPGYCVPGTVGAKVLAGEKVIEVEKGMRLQVNLQVKNLSFSAHADAKGILQLIQMCQPKNVMLVHGEARKMTILKERVLKEMGVRCFDPPNGKTLTIDTEDSMPVLVSAETMSRIREGRQTNQQEKEGLLGQQITKAQVSKESPLFLPKHKYDFTGGIVLKEGERVPRLLDSTDIKNEFDMHELRLRLRMKKGFNPSLMHHIARDPQSGFILLPKHDPENPGHIALSFIAKNLEVWMATRNLTKLHRLLTEFERISVDGVSVVLARPPECALIVEWERKDQPLATGVAGVVFLANLT